MPKVPIENTSLILKKTLATAHLLPSLPGINRSPPPLLATPWAGGGGGGGDLGLAIGSVVRSLKLGFGQPIAKLWLLWCCCMEEE
jgi:hypothetical protein